MLTVHCYVQPSISTQFNTSISSKNKIEVYNNVTIPSTKLLVVLQLSLSLSQSQSLALSLSLSLSLSQFN